MTAEAIGRNGRDATAGRWLYFGMALACIGVVALGFAPTTFIPMAQGTYSQPLLTHLHGMTVTGWMGLYAVQSWLAATGRITAHRSLGLAGIALATSIVILLLASIAVDLNEAEATTGSIPYELMQRRWSGVIFILMFAGWFAAGIANLRRADWHKRLMLMATISLLPPAFGRMSRIWLFNGEFNPGMGVYGVLGMCLMVAIPLALDWRARGRPHPVYLAGFIVYLLQPAYLALGDTPAAKAIMTTLMNAGG